MTAEPIEHVERLRPPWRKIRLTECGKRVEEFACVISADDLVAKVRRLGKQRAAMSTCMTCLGRAEAWRFRPSGAGGRLNGWEDNPSAVISRDTDGRRVDLLAEELRALAVLWEAHQAEYDGILAALAGAISLDDARRARRAR